MSHLKCVITFQHWSDYEVPSEAHCRGHLARTHWRRAEQTSRHVGCGAMDLALDPSEAVFSLCDLGQVSLMLDSTASSSTKWR